MFKRFNIDSRHKRIVLSCIALVTALLISVLQRTDDGDATANKNAVAPPPAISESASGSASSQPAKPALTRARQAKTPVKSREEAIARAVSWLKGQEGGKHHGHTIARHVGKSYAELEDRLVRDDKSIASGFTDMNTAAVAIARTIRHKPNNNRVRSWLGNDESKRRLALRRLFEKPIGRIVYRGGDRRQGNTAVVVLTKWTTNGKLGYRLLTAYVEK